MRDHLNTYDGMEAYGEAKAQIFRHQDQNGIIVLNGDDAFCRARATEAAGNVVLFTKKKTKKSTAWFTSSSIMMKQGKKEVELVKRNRLKIYGEHNVMNMLAAALVASSAGASLKAIRQTLSGFSGLADRQEILAVMNKVTFINDTTATTPDGAIAALQALAPRFKKLHVIFGGNDKDLEFDELAQVAKKAKVNIALLPGDASKKMMAAFMAKKVPFIPVSDLKACLLYTSPSPRD